MKFKVQYGKYENKPTPSGEKIVKEHREEIDKDGKRSLIKDRVVNIYENIQASREQCEIQNILRAAAEGNPNILNVVDSHYLDITGAPSSLAEAQQFVIRAKNEFDQLPKDIRAKFENNAEIYVAKYGTEEWQDATGIKVALEQKAKAEANEKAFKQNMAKAAEKLAADTSIVNDVTE